MYKHAYLPAQCWICIRIYIFCFKKHTNKKQKKLKIQKQPKKKKRKKVLLLSTASVENLMGQDYIVCEFALCIFVIKLWISPGCSYEFNIVFVRLEQDMKYTLSRTKITRHFYLSCPLLKYLQLYNFIIFFNFFIFI